MQLSNHSFARGSLIASGLAVMLVMAVSSSEARADEFPEKEVYIGAFGGAMLPLRQWDLGHDTVKDTKYADTGFLGGLRVGYQLQSRLAFELSGSLNRLSAVGADDTTALNVNIGALYHFTGAKWSPYAAAGVGLFHNFDGDLGSDTDVAAHAGVGLRGMITSSIALRVEAKDFITDEFVDGGAHNLQLTVGVDFFLGAKSKRKPVAASRDRDSDGIADSDDSCPDKAGSATMKGCPDRDNDGIADSADGCPDKSGTTAMGGCPDSDGDGLADNTDKCPNKAGTKELSGCPNTDADSDGIPDADDKCPNKAGTKSLVGCPDRDYDSVADASDQCPDKMGKPALAGCPDGDNDGVADKDDKCPKVTGLAAHQGCLPVAVKNFTGAIKGIRFAVGKATIRPSSYALLNKAAKLLKDFPGLRLRIEGHTDSRGMAAKNRALSENRANSVKAYLVSKGIAETRLTAQGFGETKPLGKNSTAAGRRSNRRIEFMVIGSK